MQQHFTDGLNYGMQIIDVFLLIKGFPSEVKFKGTVLEVLNLSWSEKFTARLNTGKMYPDKSTGYSQMVCRL